MEKTDVFSKTGRELLPQNIVEEFQEYRSALHQRILYCRLSEYTWSEWVICLQEKILLEQCLPFALEKLDMNPTAPGIFYKGEVLYDVTQIDRTFWDNHMDLYNSFKAIIDKNLDLLKKETDNGVIREDFLEAYQRF